MGNVSGIEPIVIRSEYTTLPEDGMLVNFLINKENIFEKEQKNEPEFVDLEFLAATNSALLSIPTVLSPTSKRLVVAKEQILKTTEKKLRRKQEDDSKDKKYLNWSVLWPIIDGMLAENVWKMAKTTDKDLFDEFKKRVIEKGIVSSKNIRNITQENFVRKWRSQKSGKMIQKDSK